MRGKRIKVKLRAGQPVFTTGLKFHAPRLVEMLARSGADQIFLDAEHGPISEGECEEMVRAADLHDVPVAIRVPVNEPHVILRYLDIGTSAIMVPHVVTLGDAERAVRAVKYPPEGARSFAPGRGGGGPRTDARRVRPALERGNGRLRALRGRGGSGRDRGHLPGSGPRRRGRWRLRPRSLHGPRGGAVAGGRPGRGRARPPDVPPGPHAIRDGAARSRRSRPPDRARLPADHGVDP